MALRVITLLIAVVVMTTAATSSSADFMSPDDVASAVDDMPDVDTPVVVPPPAVSVPPDQFELLPASAPVSIEAGRMYAVTVFRPPRLFASR